MVVQEGVQLLEKVLGCSSLALDAVVGAQTAALDAEAQVKEAHA